MAATTKYFYKNKTTSSLDEDLDNYTFSDLKSTQARMFQHSKFKKSLDPQRKSNRKFSRVTKVKMPTIICWPFNVYISLIKTKISTMNTP